VIRIHTATTRHVQKQAVLVIKTNLKHQANSKKYKKVILNPLKIPRQALEFLKTKLN
jgi:hypothetical protein